MSRGWLRRQAYERRRQAENIEAQLVLARGLVITRAIALLEAYEFEPYEVADGPYRRLLDAARELHDLVRQSMRETSGHVDPRGAS